MMVNEAEKVASGIGAGASLLATIWAFVSQAAEVLFGLPIQVVLACFFSSAVARTFVGSAGLLRTAGMILAYAALGAWTLPLMLHLLGLPTSVEAGVGVVISGGAQVPAVRDWVINTLKTIVQHKTGTPGGPTGGA